MAIYSIKPKSSIHFWPDALVPVFDLTPVAEQLPLKNEESETAEDSYPTLFKIIFSVSAQAMVWALNGSTHSWLFGVILSKAIGKECIKTNVFLLYEALIW